MGVDPLHPGGGRSFFRRLRVDTRPLRHRDFRNLWIGQAISTLGGAIGTVAVPYQVYKLTGSTALVGLLGLASLVPLLVVPLVGGAIADAVDRRVVLLRTETGMALITALFLVNSLLPHPQVWALFVLQAVAVAVFSLGRPAMSSLAPRLVPDDEIAAAGALDSVYSSLGAVAGPAVGGVLISVAGVPWTYGIDTVTYVASLVAIRALPKLPPLGEVERPSLRSIGEGFRFLKGKQVLIGIFLVDSNAMVFGMPSALFPAFALHRLGGNAATVGYLYAAPYAGALARVAGLRLDVARAAARTGGDVLGVRVGSRDRGVRADDESLAGARPARPRGRCGFLQRRAAQRHPPAFDARSSPRTPERDRVHAGGKRSESRRPRSRRARITHLAALLDRVRWRALHRRLRGDRARAARFPEIQQS